MVESISPWVAARFDDVRVRARHWIEVTALEALVQELDGPPRATIDELLAWTSRTFDTRAGAERRDAEPVNWSGDIVDALVRAAGPLGLLATPTPGLEAYDTVVVLGGATTGNELRTALVKDLIDKGLSVGEICGLAAERAFSASERDEVLVQEGVDTEWKHLRRCLAAAFGPLEAEGISAAGGAQPWLDHRYRGTGGQALRLLVAPSASSSRANTSNAVTFFLERHSEDRPRTVLIVTSAIYVPYQFFAVAGLLVGDSVAHIEFVGTPTSALDDKRLLAQRIGQEIHGAVASVVQLLSQNPGEE